MPITSILPSFLASLVEFVEALTIVLVVGVTVNWKSSLTGAVAGIVALLAVVSVFGTAVVIYIPLDILRIVIGIILVLFGMQWLKKSILRYSGVKAIHDEALIYEKNKKMLQASGTQTKAGQINKFGFLTSFKSVLLEGLEVAFIIITFGTASASGTTGLNANVAKLHGMLTASVGAAAALIVVVILGFMLRKPLTKIPENTLKFIVGIMLVSFGTFWSGEGFGVSWPLSDWSIIFLAVIYMVLCLVLIKALKNRQSRNTHQEV